MTKKIRKRRRKRRENKREESTKELAVALDPGKARTKRKGMQKIGNPKKHKRNNRKSYMKAEKEGE